MRNVCDSDSRCGLACDASARDAKSLAIRVERCEPVSKWRIMWKLVVTVNPPLPSDTKLLLTKNYSKIIIFEKLRISRVISRKSLSFLEILRVQIPSKITKKNSQGIIFAIISCQRVNPPLFVKGSVAPKVRLQGYGYNPFCSHGSRCLAVLVWQYFEEAFCAPKGRLKWYGFKAFPSHSSHCSGGLFLHYSGVSPKGEAFFTYSWSFFAYSYACLLTVP